jgi:hypothetical protein
VFVNPDRVVEPSWIFQLDDLAPGLTTSEPETGVEWSVTLSPTQVQLVDLLQSIVYLREGRGCPCSIVVSAWDEVVPFYNEPGEWFSDRLPLLDQYIATNSDTFPTKIFGLSAQGGRLPDDEKRLLALTPMERIMVVAGPERGHAQRPTDRENGPHDASAPLRWLIR